MVAKIHFGVLDPASDPLCAGKVNNAYDGLAFHGMPGAYRIFRTRSRVILLRAGRKSWPTNIF